MVFFKNLVREKRFIDRQLVLYEQEEKLKIKEKLIKLELQCAKDTAEHEHDYHHNLELKGIELAKIEARIEVKDEVFKVNENLYEAQKKEIKRLVKIIEDLTGKIGTSITKVK